MTLWPLHFIEVSVHSSDPLLLYANAAKRRKLTMMGAGGREVGEAEKGSEPGRPALGAHSGAAATEKPFLNCLHAWCDTVDPQSTASFPNSKGECSVFPERVHFLVCFYQVDRNRISFLEWGLLKVILYPCFLFCPAAVLSLRWMRLTELSTLQTDHIASRGPWAYWIKGKPLAWHISPAISWCLPLALAVDSASICSSTVFYVRTFYFI